jgi:hypothetical protein
VVFPVGQNFRDVEFQAPPPKPPAPKPAPKPAPPAPKPKPKPKPAPKAPPPFVNFGLRQGSREYIDRLRENPLSEEDYNRAENVLEALRKQKARKSDNEEIMADIERARLLILKRMEEYKRIQAGGEPGITSEAGTFDFGLNREHRDYLDRLRENPMTEEDYYMSSKVLYALRKIRQRKDDEATLAEIDRARQLVLDRRAEYESS